MLTEVEGLFKAKFNANLDPEPDAVPQACNLLNVHVLGFTSL